MSEKFRVASMHPADLISVDQSASPVAAMTTCLEFDTRNGSLDIIYLHQCDNAVPVMVYYGFILRWRISVLTDAQKLSRDINDGELDALLTRIMEGASSHWNGNNNVCRLSDDASAAVDEVEAWLKDRPTLPEPAGLWEAGDWFVDGVDGLTAGTTDAELETMAKKLEMEALADYAVVTGTLKYLRSLRDNMSANV